MADKRKILAAIERLARRRLDRRRRGHPAGLSAGRAVSTRRVNRVILATDGDFNVGITDRDELKGFIERERETGIFLSVLGFGMGNYNDALMQTLAQNGNGIAAYIDTLNEARKVLVEEVSSTLFPIAKDVKIQVEFNPATVARVPADRLRDPAAQPRRLQQRQGRCRRHRLRPHGDRALRDRRRSGAQSSSRTYATSSRQRPSRKARANTAS